MHDREALIEAARTSDIAVWEASVVIEKYHGDDAYNPDATPYEVTEPVHNMLMTNGVNQLWLIATGQGGTLYNAANCYVGAGDSTTVATATQTDLQATTNKLRRQISAAPTIAANVCTFSATFGASDANYVWNELALFNASAAGTMLNRFVAALGTKTNSASWTVNVAVTIS